MAIAMKKDELIGLLEEERKNFGEEKSKFDIELQKRDDQIKELIGQNSQLIGQINILNSNVMKLQSQIELLLGEKSPKNNGSNTAGKRRSSEILNTSFKKQILNPTQIQNSRTKKSDLLQEKIDTNQNQISTMTEKSNENASTTTTSNDTLTSIENKNNGTSNNKLLTSLNTNNSMNGEMEGVEHSINNDDNDDSWQRVTHKNKKSDAKQKIQPIHVKNVDFEQLYNELIKQIGINKFTINQINGNIKIHACDKEVYTEIASMLRNNNVEFFSYLHGDERKSCYLIKGLPKFELEDIKSELVRFGLPHDIILSEFISGFQRCHPELKHKFVIKLILPPNANINILKTIKTILGVAIIFEKYNSKGILQCKRCQNYFHTAVRCFQNYRCVKCTETHLPGCCNKSIDAPPQCVNCTGFHTANDHVNCSFFNEKIKPKMKSEINNKTKSNHNNIKQNGSKETTIGVQQNLPKNHTIKNNNIDLGSYAAAVKGKTQKQSNGSKINPSDLGNNNEIITLLTSLLVKMDQFIDKQKN